MFLGTFTPKLDDKGRFFLPAKFRDQLADGLVIAAFQDTCLAIFPVADFEEQARKIGSAPTSLSKVRVMQRGLGGDADDQVPDKQGRVLIPAPLRAYANLDKDILVKGAINRVEVWDPREWEKYSAAQLKSYEVLDEVVFPNQPA
jgi:MraZ protein